MQKLLLSLVAALLLVTLCTGALAEQLTISMVGDCTIGEQYCYRGYKGGYVTKMREAGLDFPFANVAELFAQDDLTIANCECALTTKRPANPDKAMSLYAPPEFAEIFTLGNVDACNMTNNHAMDFGEVGYQDTYENLTAAGLGAFGEDYVYSTEIKGIKIGLVGHTYPITDRLLDTYAAQISQLRSEGCTFIIASIHWGHEEDYKLNAQQKNSGHRLIDMGADVVYGHGPHVLQPIEYYNGKLIFYSLANFTFGANSNPKDGDTAVIQVTYDIHANGTLTPSVLTALPFRMHNKKNYQPYMFTEEADQIRVWRKLWRSSVPNSNLPESFKLTGKVYFTEEAATDSGMQILSVTAK